ncbi:MAG: anthranilate synthase component I [Planctomycetota bacterium]|nr:anthranilate synthase component I [Planctomycetota bacterium]
MDRDGCEKKRVLQVVSSELPADLETPVSAFLKLREIGASFLLESAESVDRLGRFSFIGFPSKRTLVAEENSVIYRDEEKERVARSDPLDVLKSVFGSTEVIGEEDRPSILGGAVGYVSYDYIRHLENIPEKSKGERKISLCEFDFVETLVVFDHLMRKMTVFSLVPEKEKKEPVLHKEIVDALEKPLVHSRLGRNRRRVEFFSNASAAEYAEMVKKAKHYIREGDCFQIVLSRRLRANFDGDCFDLYRRLRMSNPSPYMFYFENRRRRVIGSSPEVLVRLNGRRAFTSPIAGTRRRGASRKQNGELAEELLSSEKENAEHFMLIDLARNDLGRVCKYGSVRVESLRRIERYSHVMHIVSDVEGELRDECDQFDLFRAVFPAGTVTGAPKVRAMEIIEELEKEPRGLYAGAVGYFSPSGALDTCIAIRMIVVEDGTAYLQAGAGIVADSEPEREYQETEEKLMALKVAIEASSGGM